MSEFYNIQFNDLVAERIPPRLRQPRLLAFVSALSGEVNREYQLFRLNRQSNLYKLVITPQVCYLEKLLNDRYDFTQRRIYIKDGNDKPPTYVYRDDELKPLPLYQDLENLPVYLYTDGESGDMSDDFVVWVPVSIDFEEAEMSSLVKAYKLAGTKFKIQRF